MDVTEVKLVLLAKGMIFIFLYLKLGQMGEQTGAPAWRELKRRILTSANNIM